jgi:alkanesulfonate monooxygenase SsuD/methylene tetrahydromethanopterin reductase-like flavin-dependent oxidoreductase (luciferase family)
MKTFFFHLMPYADLDLSYTDRHNSAWVTLPNSYFDPAVGQKLYARYIGELELADQLGFDGICVNEHHQTAYGLMPAPNLIAAALARSTKQAKIAILGRALPLVSNPVAVAEEFAMLDQMSGGRIITGFVRGIGTEYFASGVNPTHSHGRYYEAHELILRAWTETGPFRYHGRHYQFDYVNLWPRPVQQPHPPLWFPGSGNPGTMEFVLQQDAAFVLLTWFGVRLGGAGIFDRFWEMCEAKGADANPHRVAVVQVCAVAETDERAETEYGPWLERAFRHGLGSIPPHFFLQPGYVPFQGLQGMLRSTAGPGIAARLPEVTFKELLDEGCVIVGSPATVRERLEAECREMRVGNLLAMLHMGEMPHELAEKSVRLFAEEVLPHVQGMWERDGYDHRWWPTGVAKAAAS